MSNKAVKLGSFLQCSVQISTYEKSILEFCETFYEELSCKALSM